MFKMYDGGDKQYLKAVQLAQEQGLLPQGYRPTARGYRKYQRGIGGAARCKAQAK